MVIVPADTVIRPSRCHSPRCLFVLSRVMPTSVPSCCCDSLTSMRSAFLFGDAESRRQPNQAAGKSAGHLKEQGILELGAGPPQTVAQHAEHPQAYGGMSFQPGQEMPPLQHQKIGGLNRHRLGGPATLPSRSAISPKNSPFRTMFERDLPALGGIAADPHPAGQHRHHAGTWITLAEDDGPCTVLGHRGIGRQLSHLVRIDLLEKGMLGKDGELVLQSRDWHPTCPPAACPFVPRTVKRHHAPMAAELSTSPMRQSTVEGLGAGSFDKMNVRAGSPVGDWKWKS